MIIYGPVPSRRLGRSLGINNIPSKICTYSCIYCQAGRTTHLQAARRAFYSPEAIVAAVVERLEKLQEKSEKVDYLSFVPNGEPTLDENLGRTIELLQPLGIRIAVITNASLLWRADVREELAKADWVSVKVDTVREDLWRKLDRPHPSLSLADVLAGIRSFAELFQGGFETETMLVRGVNDAEEDLKQSGNFIALLKPARACLSVPVRPPAEPFVELPREDSLNRGFQIYREHGIPVELLVDYEGISFSSTGDAGEDLLAITAVHPMREDAVAEYLARGNRDWGMIRDLIDQGRLVETAYRGSRFYVSKLCVRK